MRNLVRLALKYHQVLLFVTLQLFAFYLLFQNNSYHRASYVNSSNQVIGSLLEFRATISGHFSLWDENERLSAENARLRNLQKPSWVARISGNTFRLSDTSYTQQYYYINAFVVDRSTTRQHNYFTLDKGIFDGIEPEMGVIGSDGLIGVVQHANTHYSTVKLVPHLNFTTTALLKRANESGVLFWNGQDPSQAQIKDIPQHAEVLVGDTVVTTTESARYPQDIPIGTVSTIQSTPGGDYQVADVMLFTNFGNAQHVYVIKNILREEQQEMQDAIDEEIAKDHG